MLDARFRLCHLLVRYRSEVAVAVTFEYEGGWVVGVYPRKWRTDSQRSGLGGRRLLYVVPA